MTGEHGSGRLALLAIALVIYGSLFPWNFDFTRASGQNPSEILLHSWPSQWNRYVLRDVAVNVVLYIPPGMLAALALRRRLGPWAAAACAALTGTALSASMEILQIYLPSRTCSLADLLTNALGACIGAALALAFEAEIQQLWKRGAGEFRAPGLVLLLCWAGAELFPFFPLLGRTRLRAGLALLIHAHGISPVEIWANAAEWFVVGMAMEAAAGWMRSRWLATAMLVLPAQILIARRTLTWDELLGAALALLAWHLAKAKSRPQWAAWMLGSAIVLREFTPFSFMATPSVFSWVPFRAAIIADREAVTTILFRKAFDYGALVWVLRRIRLPYARAGLAVAAALGAMETAQRYFPGRSAEITDPMLALLMTFVLWRVSRPSTM
jgi:VanZ family protein